MSFERNNDDRDDRDEQDKKRVSEVEDVDTRAKREIMDARARVAEREDDIFVGAPLEGLPYSRPELVEIWQTSVVQYLERVEPLLQSDEIEQSEWYYNEVEIADRLVSPPDGETKVYQDGEVEEEEIAWSFLQSDSVSIREVAQGHDMISAGFAPPEPKRFQVHGLREVIETPSRTFQWEVVMNPKAFRNQQYVARPSVAAGLRKDELKYAVRLADEFLQEHAGIGVQLDTGEDHGKT